MSPSKTRANEVMRMPTMNDIVSFWSPATRTRKARQGTIIYEQRQGPKERGRVKNVLQWDRGGGTNIQSKQASLHSPI